MIPGAVFLLSVLQPGGSAFLKARARIFRSSNVINTFSNYAMDTDLEEMEKFFTDYSDWCPLFKSLLASADAPASALLGFEEGLIPDPNDSSPWAHRPNVPAGETDQEVIGLFLNDMHQSLLDIPVQEGEDTKTDKMFIDEGRRILCVGRYRVLQKGADDEKLFDYCWSEIGSLFMEQTQDTGSMILTPHFDKELKFFCDINVNAPLKWLGIKKELEVSSVESKNMGIRFIYQLTDIPEQEPTQESLFGTSPPKTQNKKNRGFGKKIMA